MKPRTALRAFVFAVVAAAFPALAVLPRTDVSGRWGLLFLLVAVSAVASARPVRLPGLRIEMIPVVPAILVGLGALGPLPAALIGLAGVAGAAIGRGCSPLPIHLAFNLGAVSLATAVSAGVFRLAGGLPGQALASSILPLGAATVAIFVANTGLLAAVVAIEKRQSLWSTWKTSFSWSPVSYACAYALAVAVLAAIDTIALWAVLLGLPLCWLLRALYRTHAEGMVA